MPIEYSNTNNERQNDIQVFIDKQDTQFRTLADSLEDSVNRLDSALENSSVKHSKSIDDELTKFNNAQNSRQPKDFNWDRNELELPPKFPMRKGG